METCYSLDIMPLDIPFDYEQLSEVCQQFHVVKLELFGSRAKGEARPDSDVDLLVTFEDGYTPDLAFFEFTDVLEKLFRHPVDVCTRRSVEHSPNVYKRDSILATTEPVYVAA